MEEAVPRYRCSCEYIEQAAGDGVGRCANNSSLKRLCYKMLRRTADFNGLGPVEESYEHSNEPSSSIKCWEILE
jgi:hypothetical protein